MRIAIVGAGAMGSLFGGRLAEAGEQVVLIHVRRDHIDAINEFGLRVEADDGDRRVQVRAGLASAFTSPCDLLIVFTKGLHTKQAIASAAHLVGPETWVLTLQNGLGNVDALAAHVPLERIAVGITNLPASLKGPGHVASHGLGEIRLWTASGQRDERIDQICECFERAGLRCTADPDIDSSIWEKVAFNAALNSIGAVARLPNGAIGDQPAGRRLARSVVSETLAVARAQHIRVDEQRVHDAVAYAFAHHRAHRASMLQDVLAGRPTEIETINGAVVALGRAHGVPTPVTETLLELVRLIDSQAALPQSPQPA